MTEVVNIKDYDGEDCVYIGRKEDTNMHYGNPFSHKIGSLASVVVNTRSEAVKCFEEWIKGEAYIFLEQDRRKWILENLHLLKDKKLGCFCHPKACHGDVLAKMVDSIRD